MRGSKNEPANVVHTAAQLAEVRRIGLAEIAELTSANFKRLFVKAQ
jgi:TatD DNase family protein